MEGIKYVSKFRNVVFAESINILDFRTFKRKQDFPKVWNMKDPTGALYTNTYTTSRIMQ